VETVELSLRSLAMIWERYIVSAMAKESGAILRNDSACVFPPRESATEVYGIDSLVPPAANIFIGLCLAYTVQMISNTDQRGMYWYGKKYTIMKELLTLLPVQNPLSNLRPRAEGFKNALSGERQVRLGVSGVVIDSAAS